MPNKTIISKLRKISLNDMPTGFYEKHAHKFINIKTKSVLNRIGDKITGKKILDVGTGAGGIASGLAIAKYDVVSIDVDNTSIFEEFPTLTYDGLTIPFEDNEFDTAIIVHVLHHCTDRMQVLKETMRVSKRVIFIEDTYRNNIEKLIVSINDMIGNGEWYWHPYSKPDEWKIIISNNSWKEIHYEEYSEFLYGFLYGRYVMFTIEKADLYDK